MKPYIVELSKICDTAISCYPNAGLPNPMSDTGFDEPPREGIVNLVGGCCGTTPEHIAAIVQAVAKHPPRAIDSRWKAYRQANHD